jgi:PqqD family protein of HPr-rel-A system
VHRIPEDDDELAPGSLHGYREPMWAIQAPDALAWREWDGEIVVYNGLTGSTHHLGAFGSAVLSVLIRHAAPITMSALVKTMADALEVPADTPVEGGIERALAELAELRLATCSSD